MWGEHKRQKWGTGVTGVKFLPSYGWAKDCHTDRHKYRAGVRIEDHHDHGVSKAASSDGDAEDARCE